MAEIYVNPGDTVIVRREKDIPSWKRKGFTSEDAEIRSDAYDAHYERHKDDKKEIC